MAKNKVVITDSNYDDTKIEEEILSNVNAEVVRFQCKSEEEVIRKATEAEGILNQFAPITEKVFDQLKRLKVVARYGIGIDTINVEAATNHEVVVANVPSYCEDEVSNHALSLILNCIRKINFYDESVKNEKWDWKVGRPISRLRNLTLGIIGIGKIGSRVASKASAFGFNILGYDPYISQDVFNKLNIEKEGNLSKILKGSDVITLHVPLSKKTKHLIGAKELELMKKNATIINTSRGAVIDNDALCKALADGKIAMAGLDVIEKEPPLHPINRNSLIKLSNVILTPHVAWYSDQSEIELRTKASTAVSQVLQGKKPKGLVNTKVINEVDLK